MPEIEHDGVRIYFEDHGDGPPIVLGHSFLCSGEMWAAQIGPLAEHYRVINVDQRGHGRSGPVAGKFELYDMVDDVVAVLDELDIDRAVWCGLSIGGMVAMRAALTASDRVLALILVDTHAGREKAFKKIKYAAMNLGAKTFGLRPFLPGVLPLMFGKTTFRENPGLVDEWAEKFTSVHLPSISATLGALVRRDSVLDRLREVAMPALVIVGDEDRTLPPSVSRQMVEVLPNASLTVIPGSGHLSALEQPQAVTEAMLGFLATVFSREK